MKKLSRVVWHGVCLAFATFVPPVVGQQMSPGFSEHTLESSGTQRSYMLYVPESYTGDPVPLLLGLHPSGGNPQSQVNVSGFDALADRHGFVVAFPAGIFANSVSSRSWNANMDDGVDDVLFIRDLIDEVTGMVSVDRTRIYASGFSGGARMSSRLACELSDVLAAAAPVAGIQYPDGCIPSRPVPILTFHGRADATNHYELRADSRPYWRMGVETAVDRWRQANGCTLDNETAYVTSSVTFHSWKQCEGGAEIEFYIIEDGGHTWPGARRMSTNASRVTNMDIDASQLIWEFFSRHRLR